MSQLSPVKMRPAFKDYLWGGTKLKTDFNKKTDMDIIAESWELSTHKDGQSVVSNGEYADLSLSEYIHTAGDCILGSDARKFNYFPILIKLIDARDRLSVQVHPSDSYALKHEGEYGKTELWYILDCEKGASLYYGFSRNITSDEYYHAIRNGTLSDVLNRVPVHKGDVFFIPAGTVHAIGAGIRICEIQQNSNTTYRVYDYDRRDKFGNTRPLHIEKAIDVSSLKKMPKLAQERKSSDTLLAKCDYFTTRRIIVGGETKNIPLGSDSFRSIIVADGNGTLTMGSDILEFIKGDSIFIPAQNSACSVSGNCELILSYV